ncbi:MAG: hypothetical protein HZB62_16430 [Nitrospirae bacterium]|nr:hypothetical protein [Nitrospirota bacterium]
MAITRWQTDVIVNDTIVPVNEFTQNYIGNVLLGIAMSLGHTCRDVAVHIDGNGLSIYTEKGELPLLKDFARLLVESTLKGMVSPLRGVFWLQSLIVTTKVAADKVTVSERQPAR